MIRRGITKREREREREREGCSGEGQGRREKARGSTQGGNKHGTFLKLI